MQKLCSSPSIIPNMVGASKGDASGANDLLNQQLETHKFNLYFFLFIILLYILSLFTPSL
jgi:hypothetical protein